jgi:hypothetical protein
MLPFIFVKLFIFLLFFYLFRPEKNVGAGENGTPFIKREGAPLFVLLYVSFQPNKNAKFCDSFLVFLKSQPKVELNT